MISEPPRTTLTYSPFPYAYRVRSGGHRLVREPQGLQLEPGELGVDRLGDDVDPRLQLVVVSGHVLRGQGLVGKAHVHDRRRGALGRAEVDRQSTRLNSSPQYAPRMPTSA